MSAKFDVSPIQQIIFEGLTKMPRLERFGGYPTYKAVATCLRRISFAIQLGMSGQFIACRQDLHDRPINV